MLPVELGERREITEQITRRADSEAKNSPGVQIRT